MTTIADQLGEQQAVAAAQAVEAAHKSRDIMSDILALLIHRHGKGRSFKITAQERAALAEKAPYTLQVRGTADGSIQLRAVANNG